MAKRDPVKTIKALIIQEIREENPSFTSIDLLIKSLKDALAKQNQLGIDDVAPGQNRGSELETRRNHIFIGTDNMTTTGATSFVVSTDTNSATGIPTGNEMMTGTQYRQTHGNTGSVGGRRRRSESLDDQFLAACDQIASQATARGTLGALAPVLHHLPLLYPNKEMQEAVREAFRQEINRVIAPVFPPIGPEGNLLPEPENGTVEEPTEDEEPREEGEFL